MSAPKLRFKEFTKVWAIKTLGEETSWSSGGTPSKQNESFWDGHIPWISASSMRGTRYSDSELKITEKGVIGSKLAAKGDLLLLVRGSMLFNKIPVGIATKRMAFNQDVKSVTPKKSVCSEFLLHWFSASENKLMNMVSGTGIGAGKLDTQELMSMNLCFPSAPEQTKIANFLLTVDEKITQITEKRDLLTEYKKSMMQKIFSQEIRFQDGEGRNFPVWSKKKLGDLIEVMQSGVSRMLSDKDIGLPVVRSNNLQDNKFDFSEVKFWYKKDTQGANLENFFLSKGDLLVNFINSPAQIGKVAIFENTLNRDTIYTTNLLRLTFGLKINSIFIFNFFQTKTYENFIQTITKPAVNQASFTTKEFKTLEIPVPSNAEQIKIANFFSEIDEKIAQFTQKRDLLIEYKKGLLQQMFV